MSFHFLFNLLKSSLQNLQLQYEGSTVALSRHPSFWRRQSPLIPAVAPSFSFFLSCCLPAAGVTREQCFIHRNLAQAFVEGLATLWFYTLCSQTRMSPVITVIMSIHSVSAECSFLRFMRPGHKEGIPALKESLACYLLTRQDI